MKAQLWQDGGLYRVILAVEDENEKLLLDILGKIEPHFQQRADGKVSVLVKSLVKEES